MKRAEEIMSTITESPGVAEHETNRLTTHTPANLGRPAAVCIVEGVFIEDYYLSLGWEGDGEGGTALQKGAMINNEIGGQ